MTAPDPVIDPFDVRRAQLGVGLLRVFNDAGVLNAADVHVARRLGIIGGVDDDLVLLAIALAVRAPRESHVCTDLATVATMATSELEGAVDPSTLPWPAPAAWLEALSSCPLVAIGDEGPRDRPLRLVASRLYLDRYWHGERAIAADLLARAGDEVTGVDRSRLREGLARLFPDPPPVDLSPGTAADVGHAVERGAGGAVAGGAGAVAGDVGGAVAGDAGAAVAGGTGGAVAVAAGGAADVGRAVGAVGVGGAVAARGAGGAVAAGAGDAVVAGGAAGVGGAADAGGPAASSRAVGVGGGDDGPDLQRLASAVAVLRRFSVIAGGPGTGKTTTVARLLALLDEQPTDRPLRVALAAPTGKAAARLEEAVHAEAAHLDVDDATRVRLLALSASTLHRLLGWRPGSHSRFRHDRDNQLPHDVVIVDETSMVSLSMMAKLVEAVRPDARLILVGDPDQLASVEAGAVLGDIVGPAAFSLRMTAEARDELASVTGRAVPATDPPGAGRLGDGIVVLRHVHRYGGAIATLAEAVQRGDADAAVEVLRCGLDGVTWIEHDVAGPGTAAAVAPVRSLVIDTGRRVAHAAQAGDGEAALARLAGMRVLCAHRRGPYGVDTWMAHVERWLRASVDGYGTGGRWYVGRPVMVTINDYGLHLYNGDTGVVIDDHGQPRVVFERRGELVTVSPNRLEATETVHAMTIHKSQGSQFAAVAVVLPDPTSAILTRELLYTAATRARTTLVVVGDEASLRAAIDRPVARASGLGERLWS